MDFHFAEEDREVAELARKILEDKLGNERLKEIEAREIVFDPETWAALAESNLLGVAIPEEFGGMDLGFFALCLLCPFLFPLVVSLLLGIFGQQVSPLRTATLIPCSLFAHCIFCRDYVS